MAGVRLDGLHDRAGGHKAPRVARRQGRPRPGAAPRDRHARPPAVLRRAGRALRRAGAASSRATAARERPDWMRSVRDIAVIYRGLLSELEVANAGAGRAGLRRLDRGRDGDAWRRPTSRTLVLVGAMGIKPPQGDILDPAIVGYIDYARAGFHDQKAFDRVYGAEPSTDQLEMWDICREMSFRIAWKPYMYSQTLPHLLGARARAGAGRVGRRRQDRAAAAPASAMRRRCPTPSSRSSRPAAIASTWSSPRRSPGSSPLHRR